MAHSAWTRFPKEFTNVQLQLDANWCRTRGTNSRSSGRRLTSPACSVLCPGDCLLPQTRWEPKRCVAPFWNKERHRCAQCDHLSGGSAGLSLQSRIGFW